MTSSPSVEVFLNLRIIGVNLVIHSSQMKIQTFPVLA